MVDFDTLELLEKIERFANKLKEGKVKAFSELKPEDNDCEFIVYDDSKGFRSSGDLQAYPIVSFISLAISRDMNLIRGIISVGKITQLCSATMKAITLLILKKNTVQVNQTIP